MDRRTLIIAPHPDDEILGCGGTLLRRKAEGARLAWLIVTGMTEEGGWSKESIALRDKEIDQVEKQVGFDEIFNLRLPATKLDQVPMSELVNAFSSVFKTFKPEEVFVPHRGDAHSDHRIVYDAACACTKWFRYPSVRRVLAYETPSETEFGLSRETAFHPNVFFDITNYLESKLEILKIFQSELADHPFPRSIRSVQALAEWRGANAGFLSAEAFELLVERN